VRDISAVRALPTTVVKHSEHKLLALLLQVTSSVLTVLTGGGGSAAHSLRRRRSHRRPRRPRGRRRRNPNALVFVVFVSVLAGRHVGAVGGLGRLSPPFLL
jgi:hypothetical protein